MYIGRAGDGSIKACWRVRQFEGQEELADDHPDVITFLNRPPAAVRRRAAIVNAINSATTVDELKTVLKQLLA